MFAVGFEPTPFLTGDFNQHLRPLDQACVLLLLTENVECGMTESVSELVTCWREPTLTNIRQSQSILSNIQDI